MKDLKIPEKLRSLFKRPFGDIYRGEGLKPAVEIKRILKDEKVIAVGDITLKNSLAAGIKPALAVVDLKTKRTEKEYTDFGKKVFKVTNPPGMITQELWEKIHENINNEGTLILIEGEEDLAVLPCILEADWGTVILYGQPDQGMVLVRVTEENKLRAGTILKILSKEA